MASRIRRQPGRPCGSPLGRLDVLWLSVLAHQHWPAGRGWRPRKCARQLTVRVPAGAGVGAGQGPLRRPVDGGEHLVSPGPGPGAARLLTWFTCVTRSANQEARNAMHRYNVILVDGELAIMWEDETRAEAVDRARAGAARAESERRCTLRGARRKTEAMLGSQHPSPSRELGSNFPLLPWTTDLERPRSMVAGNRGPVRSGRGTR
jgi:hypothetical protein